MVLKKILFEAQSIPRGLRQVRLWCLALILSTGTGLLFALAGCSSKPPLVAVSNVGYLGSAACSGCHPQEFSLHRATHHARTIRPVDKANMGVNWPGPGAIESSKLVRYETPSGITLGLQDNPATAEPMELALGSDRFAFTFVHIVDNHSLKELRASYYPSVHQWLPTPGQENTGQANYDENSLGRTYNEDISRHCLGCHVTALSANTITPDPKFYGVGCESCHGPGQPHVEAIKAGAKGDLHIAKLNSIGATKLNEICGKCHRNTSDVPPDELDMTQRFEPYGLMKSRCFRESGDQLSCTTCHNPHKDASTSAKEYEKVCLSCHTTSHAFGPVEHLRKACPVNPRTGCIPCHMPKRSIAPSYPIQMSDHFIRVFPTEQNTLGMR